MDTFGLSEIRTLPDNGVSGWVRDCPCCSAGIERLRVTPRSKDRYVAIECTRCLCRGPLIAISDVCEDQLRKSPSRRLCDIANFSGWNGTREFPENENPLAPLAGAVIVHGLPEHKLVASLREQIREHNSLLTRREPSASKACDVKETIDEINKLIYQLGV